MDKVAASSGLAVAPLGLKNNEKDRLYDKVKDVQEELAGAFENYSTPD